MSKKISNRWEDEWVDMPEYNNVKWPEPAITVTFKFLTQEDYDKFYSIIKSALFDGEKPFDGRQNKKSKTTWYPHKEKAKKYVYIDGEEK